MAVTVDIPDGLISFLIALVCIAAIFGAIVTTLFIIYKVKQKKRREEWSKIPKDVVLLHQLPRGRYSPNISPFALKLETYLRMAKIPYHIDFHEPYGPTGKCPWMTLNGQDYCDSQMIMEKLGQHFGKDFSSHLTLLQKAEGRAFQVMMEEHFFWVLPLWHSIVTNFAQLDNVLKLPWYKVRAMKMMKKSLMKKQLHAQGIGRLEPKQAQDLLERDLRALSYYISEKKFLFGDQPCEFDCAIFGMLVQPLWCMPGSQYQSLLFGEISNLREYCLNMKKTFWPDWNQCLYPQQVEPPSKV